MSGQQDEYMGHVYEVGAAAEESSEGEIVVDGRVLRYGVLPDGSYALREYAYDWQPDAASLARRYIEAEFVGGHQATSVEGGGEDGRSQEL